MTYKLTKTVKNVLEYLEEKDAITTVDIVNYFHGKINKVTIYRILSRLEGEGILHSFLDDKGTTCYAKCISCDPDSHTDYHAHFLCTRCGNKECVETDVYVNQEEFKGIINQEIVLLKGYCEKCMFK